MYDLLALLKHRKLILTNRNRSGTEGGNVCRLADRIAEKSDRNARLKTTHLNFRFYSRIALYAGYRDKIHIVERKLSELRHHRLDKDGGFFRIKSTCKVIECNLQNVLTHFFRMLRIVSQCLRVGDHDVDFVEFTGIL